MLQLSPYVLPAFLSAKECGVVRALLVPNNMKAAKLSGARLAPAIRSAQTLWLDDDALPWLTSRLVKIVSQIIENCFSFKITGLDEGFLLLRYQGGNTDKPDGFYDWHIDIGRSGHAQARKLSVIIQLSPSENYSGGDLEVNCDGTAQLMDKGLGTLIAFPSFALHRVSPILTGERLSLAIWAHGPAFH